MPTTVTVGSGLDYASLALAVAALETGGAAEHDFATDGIATISIQDSFEDTSVVDISAANFTNGASASASAYLKIEVDSSNRTHKYDTGKYRLSANPTTQSAMLQLAMDYVHVKHVQFILPGTAGTSDECIRINGANTNMLIEKCYFHNDNEVAQQDAIYNSNNNATVYLYDCVFRWCPTSRGCVHIQRTSGSNGQTWFIEHCTVDANGADIGIGGTEGSTDSNNVTVSVRNTAVFGAATSDFDDDYGGSNFIDFEFGSYGNISGDGTATISTRFGGTGNYANVTLKDSDTAGDSFLVTSLTSNAEDYQIIEAVTGTDIPVDAASSTAWGGGSMDSRVDTTVDIAGNSRSGTFDIGAFEVAAGGGGGSNSDVNFHGANRGILRGVGRGIG